LFNFVTLVADERYRTTKKIIYDIRVTDNNAVSLFRKKRSRSPSDLNKHEELNDCLKAERSKHKLNGGSTTELTDELLNRGGTTHRT
jgi:hypothetical protein